MYASITPDNKRLRAFDKIYIKSGESKKVSFSIPVNDFSFVNNENKSVLKPVFFVDLLKLHMHYLLL